MDHFEVNFVEFKVLPFLKAFTEAITQGTFTYSRQVLPCYPQEVCWLPAGSQGYRKYDQGQGLKKAKRLSLTQYQPNLSPKV